MRVIAGSARRVQLKTPYGTGTRPTSGQIKETLFNIIQPYVEGSRFLDLFAGSGGIGIEALSRGARECVFADSSRAAAGCIRENLAATHLEASAMVMVCDALAALKQLEDIHEAAFDIIFMDPPYGKHLEEGILEYLAHSHLADDSSMIIVETAVDTDLSYVENDAFTITREKKYKTNKHTFISSKNSLFSAE